MSMIAASCSQLGDVMSGVWRGSLACPAVVAGVIMACNIARSDSIDSAHLFGFTEAATSARRATAR
jgi:hypothetical protein